MQAFRQPSIAAKCAAHRSACGNPRCQIDLCWWPWPPSFGPRYPVLTDGALPLDVLEAKIERWIAAQ